MAKKKRTPPKRRPSRPRSSSPALTSAPAGSYRFKILQAKTPLRQYGVCSSAPNPAGWLKDWLSKRKI
jgi:hypothetical protein